MQTTPSLKEIAALALAMTAEKLIFLANDILRPVFMPGQIYRAS